MKALITVISNRMKLTFADSVMKNKWVKTTRAARPGARRPRALALLAGALALAAPSSQAAANGEEIIWRTMSCPKYMQLITGGPGEDRRALIDSLMSTIGNEHLGDRNFWNVVDGIACACRQSSGGVKDAVDMLAEANNNHVWPQVPLGGAGSPEQQRWAHKFGLWIAGRGPRPDLRGLPACALRPDLP